ncbi:MAG: hypothetical protein ACXADY_10295 [Candidatus Hodarchaeales archaeon]|jgi:hypothetical protein
MFIKRGSTINNVVRNENPGIVGADSEVVVEVMGLVSGVVAVVVGMVVGIVGVDFGTINDNFST